MEHSSKTYFRGVSSSNPLSLMESMESSIMTGQLLFRPEPDPELDSASEAGEGDGG